MWRRCRSTSGSAGTASASTPSAGSTSCCRGPGRPPCSSGGCCCSTPGGRRGRWAVPGPAGWPSLLLACEPTFLANAALATTDIAITVCLLALRLPFPRRARRPVAAARRLAVPLWFAAAVLAKASGLVFGGLCLIVIEAERRLASIGARRAGGVGPREAGRRGGRRCAPLGAARFAATSRRSSSSAWRWCSSTAAATGGRRRPAWPGRAELPDGPSAPLMVGFFENVRIFPNAGEGIARQVTHNLRGAGVYILGYTHPRYLWYYFPVALSIKLSESLLLAPVLLLALRPALAAELGGPVGAWRCCCSASTPTCRSACGSCCRWPPWPWSACPPAAVQAARSFGPALARSGRRVVGAAAVLWSGAAAWAVWPNGLCYVNRLWGDPADGDRLVSDANWDWGQGLKELARWQRRQGGELDVWYFGAGPDAETAAAAAAAPCRTCRSTAGGRSSLRPGPSVGRQHHARPRLSLPTPRRPPASPRNSWRRNGPRHGPAPSSSTISLRFVHSPWPPPRRSRDREGAGKASPAPSRSRLRRCCFRADPERQRPRPDIQRRPAASGIQALRLSGSRSRSRSRRSKPRSRRTCGTCRPSARPDASRDGRARSRTRSRSRRSWRRAPRTQPASRRCGTPCGRPCRSPAPGRCGRPCGSPGRRPDAAP